jgi:hypothetical protein
MVRPTNLCYARISRRMFHRRDVSQATQPNHRARRVDSPSGYRGGSSRHMVGSDRRGSHESPSRCLICCSTTSSARVVITKASLTAVSKDRCIFGRRRHVWVGPRLHRNVWVLLEQQFYLLNSYPSSGSRKPRGERFYHRVAKSLSLSFWSIAK